jgi:hypothetical protein
MIPRCRTDAIVATNALREKKRRRGRIFPPDVLYSQEREYARIERPADRIGRVIASFPGDAEKLPRSRNLTASSRY